MICRRPFSRCRTLLILPLLLASASVALAQEEKPEVEVWRGSMEVQPGNRLTIEIRAWQEGEAWKATLKSVVPSGPEITANEFNFAGTDVGMKVRVGDVTAEFVGTRDGNEAKGTWTQDGRDLPLTLLKETLVEAWNGTLVAPGGELELQFRVLNFGNSGQIVRFDSLTQNVIGIAAGLTQNGAKIIFKVPQLQATFEGELDASGEKAKGLWKQSGVELPMEFKRSASEAPAPKLPKPPSRPQTPHGPFPYEVVDVNFRNEKDNVTLAGTLTYPQSEEQKKFPVVVLISGSGPQDRDETLFHHKPFLVIADQLTRAGIAVLRFDDRGTGASTGDFGAATTEDFADDVRAAVAFLKAHESIDTTNIGLVGHSEGGLIAPMVAASHPDDIAFIVMLAGPGVNGFEILRDQGRRIAEAEGVPADAVAAESELRDTVALAVRNAPEIVDGDQVVETAIRNYVAQFPPSEQDAVRPSAEEVAAFKQLALPWFRFFLRYEPSSSLQSVRCPVLALNGERDLQVWHETNLPAIADALEAGGNKNFRAIRMAGLNHLFQRAKTGAVSEYNEITQTMAPEVLDIIRSWIEKQVR